MISTLTGSVLLQVLPRTDAEVRLETRGEISTDYSIEIERAPGEEAKKARAVLGAGGQVILVSSESGAVRLLEGPIDE